jgi:alkylation response protein AidB-like acyl-CoA dehydrogenase
VDFWLNDEQRELQAAVRSLVQGSFDLTELASAEGSDRVITRWDELAAMGIFSMRSDGLGAREAVLAFEELGRGLVPGPIVAQHLAAGLVDGAEDGTAIVGLYEPGAEVTMVEHAAEATSLLWFDDGEVRCVDTAALTLKAVEHPLDPLSPVWLASGNPPAGTTIASGADATRLRQLGVTLTAALQLGVALGATELAVGYAAERHQFGRPIGSFQAVKHILADMLAKAEVARSAVYAAACALDDASPDDPERASAVAKVIAGDAALYCGRFGIQVHGGMGFTWEVNAQRFWKRAVVLDATLGSSDHHAAALAEGPGLT